MSQSRSITAQEFIDELKKEKDRLSSLVATGAFNVNPEAKLAAYQYLIEIVEASPKEFKEKVKAALNEPVQEGKNGEFYTLPGMPYATVLEVLNDNRGLWLKEATSKTKLEELLGRIKYSTQELNTVDEDYTDADITTDDNQSSLDQPEVQSNLSRLDEEEFLIHLLSQDLNKLYSKQRLFYSKDKSKIFILYQSANNPGEWRVDVADAGSVQEGRSTTGFYDITGTWKIDRYNQLRFVKRPDFDQRGVKILLDKNDNAMSKKENKFVIENIPSQKMKNIIIDPKSGAQILRMKKYDTNIDIENKDTLLELTSNEKINLCIAILRAVQEKIHGRGVIHLDLKPANIRIKKDNKGNFIVNIIDFDSSKKIGEKLTHAVGTSFYMPEEVDALQYDRLPFPVTEQQDIYSIGSIFHEIGISSILGNENKIVGKMTTNLKFRPKTIDEVITTFEKERLKLIEQNVDNETFKKIEKAYVAANWARNKLRKLSSDKETDINKIKSIIQDSFSKFANQEEGQEIIQEYLHTLGIQCLMNCESKKEILDRIDAIIKQFLSNKELAELSNKEKIKKRYEKLDRNAKKTGLTLDDAAELNEKNIISLTDDLRYQTKKSISNLLSHKNPSYPQKLYNRAMANLDYSRKGILFDSVSDLLVYQQKQDVIQVCINQMRSLKEGSEEKKAYLTVYDIMRQSLDKKDESIPRAIYNKRKEEPMGFSFFLNSIKSLFYTLFYPHANIFTKVCTLPDPREFVFDKSPVRKDKQK